MFAVAFGLLGPTAALADPAAAVGPSDSPSPTPSVSPSPAAPGCDSGLTSPGRNWGSPLADEPNQGVITGTSFTNPTTSTFSDTVFEVQIYDIDGSRDDLAAHFPTINSSWDEGAWRAIGPWSQNTASDMPGFSGRSLPGFLSARMPGITFAPGTTHTLRFWAAFPPGTQHARFDFVVFVDQPGCPSGALGSTAPLDFTFVQTTRTPPPAGRVAAAVSSTPETTPPVTADPTTTGSVAPTLVAEPRRADPPSSGTPWTAAWLGAAAALFAAVAARMAVGWWSAGRRLP
jgi:hypothetical protein